MFVYKNFNIPFLLRCFFVILKNKENKTIFLIDVCHTHPQRKVIIPTQSEYLSKWKVKL